MRADVTGPRRMDPEWREFERLVARIEADAGPRGAIVKSLDRVRCMLTGRMREVDATIRTSAGTAEILVTIECRRRTKVQDVTWLEQLATKRSSIGADRTIAVSLSGFSPEAEVVARRLGLTLRRIADVRPEDLASPLGLDMVVFWHKGCACTGVGVRAHRSDGGGAPPEPNGGRLRPSRRYRPYQPLSFAPTTARLGRSTRSGTTSKLRSTPTARSRRVRLQRSERLG